MNMQYDEQINTLKEATDWSLCRDSLAVLATKLKPDDVISIILHQAKQFILLYLEDAPNDVAIIESISTMDDIHGIEYLKVNSQKIFNILQEKAGTPGINNYRNALRKIGQLVTFDSSSANDVELFTDIISAIILACEDYRWGTDNRELWQKWFEHKNKEDFFIRARYFVTDPHVIALNQQLWGQVAEGITRVIK